MNIKTLAATTMAVAVSTTSTFAGGTDFFWSLQNIGGGAVNDDVTANLNPGDTATLYLYYSTNGPADSDLSVGAGLNVTTSTSGVIRFLDAETFDFNITVGGVPIGNRLLDAGGGGGAAGTAHAVTDDVVTGLTAFTITGGSGILESNNGSGAFRDEGYDNGADAFLYGSVTFEVIGGGSVDINAAANVLGIVNGDTTVNATFGGATINAIPAAADVVVNGAVIANPFGEFGALYDVGNIFDQSGLSASYTSGVTEFDSYAASTNAIQDGNQNDAWFSASEPTLPDSLDFDLGATWSVNQLALWTYTNSDENTWDDFEVYVDDNAGFSSPAFVGAFTHVNSGPMSPRPAQVFDLADAVGRYVRITLTSRDTFVVGMGEVAFGAGEVVCDPDSGDVNGDGCVTFQDIVTILGQWGGSGDPGIPGDANCDGIVSFQDILLVLATWNEGPGCP